jgi:hypothetical protein
MDLGSFPQMSNAETAASINIRIARESVAITDAAATDTAKMNLDNDPALKIAFLQTT